MLLIVVVKLSDTQMGKDVNNFADDLRVSILIPSYNHANYIEQSVRSVWGQHYNNLELIVVDDESSDDSMKILRRLEAISPIKMIVIGQKNTGICGALNKALSSSTGSLIGILASDDVMLPDRISDEVINFNENSSLKVLYTNGKFLTNNKMFGDLHKKIKIYLKRGINPTLNFITSNIPAFYVQSMLIKKSFLLELGGFDEKTGSDDWSLHIRIFSSLRAECEYAFIDKFSFAYRVHPSQIHRTSEFMSPMVRRVVREYFSIESRSKMICKEFLRRGFKSLVCGRRRIAWRYILLAKFVGFRRGVPVVCLIRFLLDTPGFISRSLRRGLGVRLAAILEPSSK